MRITLKNFCGVTGEWELGNKGLIVGHNAAGKTTILHAIQFIMLGYVPSIGKNAAAIRRLLAGSAPASVKWTNITDAGRVEITREIKATDKGASVTTFAFDGNRRLTKEAATGWIASVAPDVLFLDFGALRSLTGAARKQALMNLLGSDGAEERQVAIYNGIMGETKTPALYCALLPAAAQKVALDVLTTAKTRDPDALMERIRELKCASVTAYDAAGQAVAGLAAQVTDEAIALAHRLPELTDDVARRRALIADKRATAGAAERAAQNRANIERAIVDLGERIKAQEDKAGTLTQAQAAVDAATQALASSTDSSGGVATEQAEVLRCKVGLDNLAREDKPLEKKQSDIVATGKATKEFLAAVDAGTPPECPIGGQTCPVTLTCGKCGDKAPGLLADYYATMRTKLAADRDEWKRIAAQRKLLADAMAALQVELAAAETRLNDRIAQSTQAVREHEQRKAKLAAAKAELAAAQAAAQTKANAERDLAQRQAELKALPQVTVASEEETEAMKVALAAAEANLSDAVSAAAAVDAMHSPLQDDAGKVKAFWAEVLDKATAANLAWYQALCGTFLDDMSESLAALGVVKDGVPGKAYIDLGADRLALGVDFNGVRVDAELLSGSEFTRFAWAVATASQDRALVLGELETMADSTMEIAFRWLDSKPELRCVLATCHGDPAKPLRQRFPYVSDSWQIAEVGRLAA